MNEIDSYIELIKEICKQFHVKSLYVFGSILTDKFNNNSDIDFLVDFNELEPEDYSDNYFDFKFTLQDLFQKNIDLIESKALKNPFFIKSINSQKRLIYG